MNEREREKERERVEEEKSMCKRKPGNFLAFKAIVRKVKVGNALNLNLRLLE